MNISTSNKWAFSSPKNDNLWIKIPSRPWHYCRGPHTGTQEPHRWHPHRQTWSLRVHGAVGASGRDIHGTANSVRVALLCIIVLKVCVSFVYRLWQMQVVHTFNFVRPGDVAQYYSPCGSWRWQAMGCKENQGIHRGGGEDACDVRVRQDRRPLHPPVCSATRPCVLTETLK